MSLPFFNLSSRNKKFRSVERTVFDWLLTVKLDCDWWRFSFYSQKFWLWRFSKSVTAKINFWLWRFFEADTAKKNFWLWRFFESQKNGCGKNEISFWLWNLSGPNMVYVEQLEGFLIIYRTWVQTAWTRF